MRAYEMLKNEISIKERPFDLFWYFIFIFRLLFILLIIFEFGMVERSEKNIFFK